MDMWLTHEHEGGIALVFYLNTGLAPVSVPRASVSDMFIPTTRSPELHQP